MARDYWLILRHTVNIRSARRMSSYERNSHERISFLDENPWDPVMGPGAIAFTSVLMPLTAASLSFSIYKYYTWLRYKGFQWSFVQVVLLANIIGNIGNVELTHVIVYRM